MESQPVTISPNGKIRKFKRLRKVHKNHVTERELQIMRTAGDCAVKVYGRTLHRLKDGNVEMSGNIMDLETPLDRKTVQPHQRKNLMQQMITVVHDLHRKGVVQGDIRLANMLICSDGKVRLCDFAEARKVDEDPDDWEGQTTANYISPNRSQNFFDHLQPPQIEDDLYSLGVSIWELYTGKLPLDDVYVDDIIETLKGGGTVNVTEVEEESVREIVSGYLRYGGAKV